MDACSRRLRPEEIEQRCREFIELTVDDTAKAAVALGEQAQLP